MAYLFNALSDEGDEGKQNIFAQGAATGTGGQGIEKGGPSAQPSGGGGGGGGSGSAQAAGQKQQQSYNPQSVGQAYASASKSMQLPTQALGRAEGSLAKGSEALQNAANAYSGKATTEAGGYGLSDETLSGAAAGEDKAFQTTADRLNQADPSQRFEAFKAPEVPGVQNVRDVGSIYRPEAGPNYSAGQSRLDAALLRRNPEFIKRQQEILRKGSELGKEASEKEKTETEKARGMLGTEYGKQTDIIRGKIGGLAEGVISAAKQKEIEEEGKRAGLNPSDIAAKEQETVKKKIKEDLSRADPHSAEYRALKYLDDQYDLGQFANVDKDVDWREFIGDPEAQKYNRLQGLLGKGEMLTPSQAGAGPESTFNESGAYQNILDQIRGKRSAEDIKDRGRMAAIQAGATGRAGESQKAIKKQYEEMMPAYRAMKNAMGGQNIDDIREARGGRGEFAGTEIGTKPYEEPGYQDPSYSWQEALSPEEISEMNALQADLGELNPVNYQASTANPWAKNQAMEAELAKYKGGLATPPPAVPKAAASGGGGGGGTSSKKAPQRPEKMR